MTLSAAAEARETALLAQEIALRHDLAGAGVVRTSYRRLPTRTELASGALFAAMDDLTDGATADLARIVGRPGAVYLRNVRRRIDVVRADPADLLATVSGLNRQELGAGYTRSRNTAVAAIAARLEQLVDDSADAAEKELRQQGITPSRRRRVGDRDRLIRAYAESVVDEPALRAAQAVERSIRSNPVHPDAVDRALAAAAEAIGAQDGSGTRDLLHQLTLQAQAMGRAQVLAQAPAGLVTWVASEIRDEHTCRRCLAIDGEEFATWEEAERAYPIGGYLECLGGMRCRGTVIVAPR